MLANSQTFIQTNSQEVIQVNSQTVIQANSQVVMQIIRHTVIQANSQTVMQANSQTVMQANSQTVSHLVVRLLDCQLFVYSGCQPVCQAVIAIRHAWYHAASKAILVKTFNLRI